MAARTVMEFTITIDRPPAAVFDYVVDVSKHSEWSPSPFRVEGCTGPVKVGDTFSSIGVLPGDKNHRNEVTVTESSAPKRLVLDSEEHGAVWLTYLPDASSDDIARLAALAKGQEYVLVSPYPGQPGKFMASTWGAQLSVDTADDARLKTFVDTYAGGGQGGEKGADCAHGLTPAEAQAAFDKANG